MTRGFRRTRDGRLAVRLSADEAALLRDLVEQVVDLIDDSDPSRSAETGPETRSGTPPETQPGTDTPDPRDLAAMLGIGDATGLPDDPVLARLLPDGYQDPEAAGEFRRYTERELRDSKRASAGEVLAATAHGGGTITLDAEQADSWLRALNDVRLALGTRLDINEDAHEELNRMAPSDPRYPGYVAYDWLSFLQETLVRALW